MMSADEVTNDNTGSASPLPDVTDYSCRFHYVEIAPHTTDTEREHDSGNSCFEVKPEVFPAVKEEPDDLCELQFTETVPLTTDDVCSSTTQYDSGNLCFHVKPEFLEAVKQEPDDVQDYIHSDTCCTTSDAVSDQVDETQTHLHPVVVLETLNVPRLMTKYNIQINADGIFGEVSATSKDSQRNMCTSRSRTQLLSCNDHLSVDSCGPQRSHTVDRSRRLSACTVCGKIMQGTSINGHMRTHARERPHHCNVCGENFKSFHELEIHMRSHTGDERHVCGICGVQFVTLPQLTRHKRAHMGKKRHSCDVCHKTFARFEGLKRHMRTVCPCKFANPADLHLHMSIHNGDCSLGEVSTTDKDRERNMCTTQLSSSIDHASADSSGHQITCTNSYHQISNVQEVNIKDELSGTNTDTFSSMCTTQSTTRLSSSSDHTSADSSGHQITCTNSYHQISNVQEVKINEELSAINTDSFSSMCTTHSTTQLSRSSHHASADSSGHRRPSACGVCGKITKRMKRHMRVHTDERPYHCNICARTFREQSSLRHHLSTHTGQKPFCCQVCGKAFARAFHLKVHSRTHSSERSHAADSRTPQAVCTVCGKSLNQKKMKYHMRIHTGETPYSCHLCTMKFAVSGHLARHLRVHTGERPYACDVCSMTFSHRSSLTVHMRQHSGEKPHSCSVCQKKFAQSGNLMLHMRRHTGEKPFRCMVCGKTFARSDALKCHQRTHIRVQTHSCEVCACKFANPADLHLHMSIHNGDCSLGEVSATDKDRERNMCTTQLSSSSDHASADSSGHRRPSACSVCGKITKRMKRHMRVHTDERPYHCNICTRTFREQSSLRHHLSTHTGQKPFCCQVCGKAFARAFHLKVHSRTHSSERDHAADSRAPQAVCTVCGKSLNQKKMKYHMRIHTGEKPYSCHLCTMKFAVSGRLARHLRVHTGERPYACEVCSMTFSHRSTLTVHMRQHSGEKPHSCSVCQKKFAQSGYLMRHMRGHTGERPFCCTVCGKTFAHPEVLKRHTYTHTGEKPHSCRVCGRNFANPSNLILHMRTHTGEQPYSCDVCGKKFANPSNFKLHKRIHTRQQS